MTRQALTGSRFPPVPSSRAAATTAVPGGTYRMIQHHLRCEPCSGRRLPTGCFVWAGFRHEPRQSSSHSQISHRAGRGWSTRQQRPCARPISHEQLCPNPRDEGPHCIPSLFMDDMGARRTRRLHPSATFPRLRPHPLPSPPPNPPQAVVPRPCPFLASGTSSRQEAQAAPLTPVTALVHFTYCAMNITCGRGEQRGPPSRRARWHERHLEFAV